MTLPCPAGYLAKVSYWLRTPVLTHSDAIRQRLPITGPSVEQAPSSLKSQGPVVKMGTVSQPLRNSLV